MSEDVNPVQLPKLSVVTAESSHIASPASDPVSQQRGDANGTSKAPARQDSDGDAASSVGLPRLDSSGSIDSLAGASKTANFFASSPVLKAPSTSRPHVGSGHARHGSGSSFQSLSAIPPQLLPPANLLRSPSSSSTANGHAGPHSDYHTYDTGSGHPLRQSSSRRQHERQPSSFRTAAIHLSSPSDYYDTSALSSAGSIRSRRNWDEFEGKPITPLPSPGIGQEEMESRDSMFAGAYTLGSYGLARGAGMHSDSTWARLINLNGEDSISSGDNLLSIQPSPFLSAPEASTNFSGSSSRSSPPPAARAPSEQSGTFRSTEMATRSVSKTKNFFTASHTPIPPARTPVKGSEQLSHARSVSNQSGTSTTSWDSPPSAISNPVQSPWLPLRYQKGDLPASTDSLAAASGSHLASPPTTLWSKRPGLQQRTPDSSSFPLSTTMTAGSNPSAEVMRSQGSPVCQASSSSASTLTLAGEPTAPATHEGRPEAMNSGPLDGHKHDSGEQLRGSNDAQAIVSAPDRASRSTLSRLSTSADSSAQSTAPPHRPLSTSRMDSKADTDAPLHSPSTVVPSLGGRGRSGTILDDDSAMEESEDEATSRVGRYRVERTLGVGAFSRVVLGAPLPPKTAAFSLVSVSSPLHSPSVLSEDGKDIESSGKEKDAAGSRLRALHWPRPWRKSSMSHLSAESSSRSPSRGFLSKRTTSPAASQVSSSSNLPASLAVPHSRSISQEVSLDLLQSRPATPASTNEESYTGGELVALKMIERQPCEQNERMRVSWVREVEVLKHIEHPSLIKFINAFSTPRHHVLVLERVGGGELFDLLSAHHSELAQREWLIRRLFAELANAVGWMHSIQLVHRDIKLENIILTRDLFTSMSPGELTPSAVGPVPLLKLTDFGLSRFMDPNKAFLETRCGSEEYAAPELIIGKKYDGRKTDCWAMGVVLYSLICGGLPFVEGSPGTATSPSSLALGGFGVNSTSANLQMVTNSTREGPHRGAEADDGHPQRDARKRKAHLLRIAKGDLRWPSQTNDESLDMPPASLCPTSNRLVTPYAKHIVSRLLRRDANKRGSAWECFEDPWLTHGSFLSTEGGEGTARGEVVELPPDPRTAEGAMWLSTRAYVRAGVGSVAKVD